MYLQVDFWYRDCEDSWFLWSLGEFKFKKELRNFENIGPMS